MPLAWQACFPHAKRVADPCEVRGEMIKPAKPTAWEIEFLELP